MTDYIKKEDAKDAVINIVGWEKIAKYVDEMSKHPSTKDIDYYDALIDAEDVIDDLPSADVAPVVRCRDCKCWTEWSNGTGSCSRFALDWLGTDADDFCSMGERKNNG